MDLNGKVAIVTGAGRGIGKAIASGLAEHGCKVVLASRTENELNEAARQIAAQGGEAYAIPIDLSQKANADSLIEKTVAQYGTVDIVINNAAILYATPLDEVTEEEWDQVMAVNLKSPFFLSQAAFRIMKARRSGYIINVSSTAALDVPAPLATYGTSKAGMIGFNQALYHTAKEYGVKVSLIYPGMTDTEMLRGFDPPVDSDRWMLPEDIVGCVLFLLKQSSRVVIREVTPWAARHDQI